MLKKNEKKQANKLLGKFLLWSDIPFSVARNNPFFQPVVDVIAIVGPRYNIPSYDDFRGNNTNAEIIRRAIRSLEELKQERVAKAELKKQLAGC